MKIRAATPDDIPVLHALIERAYRGESAKRGWTHEADLLTDERTDVDELAVIIADQDQAILMAHSDAGALVGCVCISRKYYDSAYLGLLTVDPVRQATGLGKLLLATAEAHAAKMFAATTIEMTVIAKRKELIAYYERRGYALTGEIRPFPHDTAGQATPEPLHFVVLQKPLKHKETTA